jgi:hypothetical protein
MDEVKAHVRPYEPSPGVNWAVFLPCCLLPLSGAAIGAYWLQALFTAGHYYLLIVPAFLAFPVAGLVMATVYLGRCRSRLVGALLGLLAGLVLYVGQYHVDLIQQRGPQAALRLDWLAEHLVWRKEVEQQVRVGAGAARAQPRGGAALNWFNFVMELGLVLSLTVGGGLSLAGRPYCAKCRRWMKREAAFLPAGSGDRVVWAVEEDCLPDLKGLPSLPPPSAGSYTAVTVAWCPPVVQSEAKCPAYLSVKEVRLGGGIGQFSQVELVFGRTLLWMHPLTRRQVGQLRERFPALERLLERPVRDDQPERPTTAVAVVEPVEDPGRILSPMTKLIGNALEAIILVLFFGGFLLVVLGGVGVFWLDAPRRWSWGLGGVGVGLVSLVVGGILGTQCPSFLSFPYLRSHARSVVRRRPGPWVDPDDPDAELVDVVPRENWGKLMVETASDVGFLLVDGERGEVRFEGDHERWRVPVGSIQSCVVEEVAYAAGSAGETRVYFVVLEARRKKGVLEVPLARRGDMGSAKEGVRRKWAQRLRKRVLELGGEA